MKPKFGTLEKKLSGIKKNNLLRNLQDSHVEKQFIKQDGRKLLNFSSNDYLGIKSGKIKHTQFQSSSRLVSGNDASFSLLEKKLAKHKSQEQAIIFPTGYMANLGMITSIATKHDTIFSDELNHASIVEACKLSGSKIKIFKHNNIGDLERKVQKTKGKKILITEGVFSMDGDWSKLNEICQVSEKHGMITVVDDAHGDFVLGKDGKGTANFFDVEKKIDLYVSSLSKGLGSFGGYVCGRKKLIDLCINTSKTFIYTSALPSSINQYSLNRFNSKREIYREKLWKKINLFHKRLEEIELHTTSTSQIIPIIIGNEKKAMEFSKFLRINGIFAQAIRYPTVKKDQARIRISITGWLSNKEIEYSIQILEKAKRKFNLK
ncbi:8-amino-7-oxononanoate synthase [Candidatus Nitrosopelagicus brevis]|uniref:8-amino-7-oxononanoate synthase n=1 Tax=Candidatus Nitrosopelagicus brevis TaxID=1410606 RepID=A0A0A7V1I3_9ARCH|nr:aminotransferase class I/II-fold pyridoxal phosphate-dependent enzyme [Candidatus Nitrosopelagicus brevis]AJA92929.1 putative 8-amino-7-oxononanoate synthase [Candidatus Nitrosopelagicus brevis]PTL87977.1 8-amino-7-oxononanoate synthase [Candidatus Nitrosopelagicus brevis]